VYPVIVDNSGLLGELPDSSGKGLLLWGIGLSRRSNPFLAYIPSGLEIESNIRYYAGKEEGSHRIIWSKLEQDAIALFDHPVIGEFSVTWNSILGVWVMLYNNDTDPYILGRRSAFIQYRTALKPWGPWSEPRI